MKMKLPILAMATAVSALLSSCSISAGPVDVAKTWATPDATELPGSDGAPSFARFAKPDRSNTEVRQWLDRWQGERAGTAWTQLSLELIVKYQQNPLRASRMLAYVHVAMNDAIALAARHTRDINLHRVAMHGAAATTLDYFYPQESPGRLGALGYSAALAASAATKAKETEIGRYWNLGTMVGRLTTRRAANDGADAGWKVSARPAPAPGRWGASPPLNVYRPLEPRAGQWRTWVLKDGSELVPPPPTPYDSPAYWAEAEEVLQTRLKLTATQKRIADDWNLGLGTVTPAGVWNRHALEISQRKRLDTAQAASLFAMLNVAMHDAFIACWNAKFTYWTARPVTTIRAKLDRDFMPHLITPPFPSYVSGHSTASGAAAEVLAAHFPDEATRFQAMAEEASRSRLYGGIHFASDNEEGLRLGRQIGIRAVSRGAPASRP